MHVLKSWSYFLCCTPLLSCAFIPGAGRSTDNVLNFRRRCRSLFALEVFRGSWGFQRESVEKEKVPSHVDTAQKMMSVNIKSKNGCFGAHSIWVRRLKVAWSRRLMSSYELIFSQPLPLALQLAFQQHTPTSAESISSNYSLQRLPLSSAEVFLAFCHYPGITAGLLFWRAAGAASHTLLI